jgi:type IV secretory pathway VirB10-like protein
VTIDVNGNNKNGNAGLPATQVAEAPGPAVSQRFVQAPESADREAREEPTAKFATRADAKGADGISKGKLLLLGGGLAVAVLFFVLTAIVSKSPRKLAVLKPLSQQSKQEQSKPFQGSVTPLMDTVHTPAPDNTSGQVGPSDIRRTRALENGSGMKPPAGKPAVASSLGNVPSFADTQQKWEDPAPYGGSPAAETPQTQQNSLKEPSLIFVRSMAQNKGTVAPRPNAESDDPPRLELTPGTRIQAKLETQISSAVLAPVVAVVEYTYAIGDRIIVPAGARVYGQLQQADRSGLVSVKFDEIELLDGALEKIDAVGTGLDLGPIKGIVYGKNTGKNFLVRAASGLGSVLAEVAGNNSSAAFSEDDMLRERLAENIGTAGDSEVMSLNANSRVVVSVPADTKIYIVFTKHEQTPSELHRAAPAAQ